METLQNAMKTLCKTMEILHFIGKNINFHEYVALNYINKSIEVG